MICSNCGKEILDGALFCTFCGSKCAKKRCVACGAELKEEQLFCHECGLKWGDQVPEDIESSQKMEITDSETVREKPPAEEGIAAWTKKARAKKTFNIVCIIRSVFLLLITVLLAKRIGRFSWYDYDDPWSETMSVLYAYYFSGLACAVSIELIYIICICYESVHKVRNITIADTITSTVLTVMPFIVLIFIWFDQYV